MRYCKYLILIICFLPVKIFAQKNLLAETDLTGLWKGTLYNDTTKQYYRYEVAISKEKGKLTGYSHTWFILDDKQYYGVKKVKVKQADDKLIIEDDELIANNYPEAPAKGVRQMNVLNLNIKQDTMTLTGPFSTNPTKKYSVLTGYINLQKRDDYWQSSLVPHLEELGLVNELSFIKNDVVLNRNNQIIRQNELAKKKSENYAITKPSQIVKNNQPIQEIKKEDEKNKIVKNDKPQEKPDLDNSTKTDEVVLTRKERAKEASIKNKAQDVMVKQVIAPLKSNEPAAEVLIRKTLLQQTVFFKSDSLQLSLYDNGEVDGDTVSVLMNGNVIMPKVGLSTNAVRKTIFIDQNIDSIQLVMYAENLGSIPPNTGLLVVRDGKEIYEIRFSGDLQRNSAIVFRRKKE